MTHAMGLRCPDCGHSWPGHAMYGSAEIGSAEYGSAEYCPVCWDGQADPLMERCPVGQRHEGSVAVAGCDRHAAVAPCPFCAGI